MENRISYDEDVATLTDINDIRNGVLVNTMIRRTFDRRVLAILKVCHFCPPISTFSDPFAATGNRQAPNHIQPQTFSHATTELILPQMSVIRLINAIPCNG